MKLFEDGFSDLVGIAVNRAYAAGDAGDLGAQRRDLRAFCLRCGLLGCSAGGVGER